MSQKTISKDEQVEIVLNEARPYLEMHGGGIQLIEVTDDGVVRVSLRGHCVGCALSTVTLRLGVEQLLKQRLPEFVTGLEEV